MNILSICINSYVEIYFSQNDTGYVIFDVAE